MSTTTNSFNPRFTYLVGAQYINGPWQMTNRQTGEVTEGVSDKWVFTFLVPFGTTNNLKKQFGHSISKESVKNDSVSFVFGKNPQDFSAADVEKLIGSPVYLDYDISRGESGTRAVLRSITPIGG